MGYAGGKDGPGIYHRIISVIPPHSIYVEPFLGGGAVLRHMRPCALSFGLDLDRRVIDAWGAAIHAARRPDIQLRHGCAFALLEDRGWLAQFVGTSTVVYLDPPYLLAPGKRGYYENLLTTDQHRKLLQLAGALACPVLISGYRSPLYDALLSDWRRIDYRAMTRGGPVDESLWLNYTPGPELHDYRFIGRDFRDRERIRRKQRRLIAGLARLPVVERRALMQALNGSSIFGSTVFATSFEAPKPDLAGVRRSPGSGTGESGD